MYVFEFFQNRRRLFACRLQCGRCEGTKKNGQRCTLTSCIGTPYCWIHLLSEKKLRIKESIIQEANKGLFAMDKQAGANDILFRVGDTIIEYGGEVVSRDEIDERYEDFTSPYGLAEGRYGEDGACRRGVGTIANHGGSRRSNARYVLSRGANRKFKLVATKNIRNGSEVLTNYGDDYVLREQNVRHKTSYKKTFR